MSGGRPFAPEIRLIRPGLWLVETIVEDFDVRAVLVAGTRRAVVWDTLDRPAHMSGVAEMIPDLPFTVAYSHGDWDHVWGTAGLSRPWTEILAHDACRSRFAHELPDTLSEKRAASPGEYDDVILIPPTRTFRDTLTLELGGITMEIHGLPGHTPDTMVGLIPEWGVLLAGDAVEVPLPFLNPGSPAEEWAQGLEDWAEAPACSLVIPSHGPLGGPELLRRNAQYLRALLAGEEPELSSDLPSFYVQTHEANRALMREEGRAMSLKTSSRGAIPPFIVMDVLRAANARQDAGGRVYHLEVGQPGTGAPSIVVETIRNAVGQGRMGYTDAMGIPPLRQRIARHYQDTYGVAVDPARIAVTTGSSGAFLLGFLSAFDEGDRVAVASPGYPAYRNILAALGVEVVEVHTSQEDGFRLNPELVASTPGRLDGLVLASPANPTGTVMAQEELADLVQYCAGAGIRLISDEIYHGITYDREAHSALELTGDALVINSFSKYYSMTGWRLGWMVLPEELVRPVECLAQNFFISPPTLSQVAAVQVFEAAHELDAHVARYARNRARILETLPRVGIRGWGPADGAFYVYADVRSLTDDSEAFCRRMLAESGIATTPGTDFDPGRGRGYLRISFAGSEEEVADAMGAMEAWLGGEA